MLELNKEVKNAFTQFRFCAPILIALVDQARQDIVIKLSEAGDKGMNVTDLALNSNLSRPAISHHLKVLKDSGLISAQKQGTQVFYKLHLENKLDNLDGLRKALEVLIAKAKEG